MLLFFVNLCFPIIFYLYVLQFLFQWMSSCGFVTAINSETKNQDFKALFTSWHVLLLNLCTFSNLYVVYHICFWLLWITIVPGSYLLPVICNSGGSLGHVAVRVQHWCHQRSWQGQHKPSLLSYPIYYIYSFQCKTNTSFQNKKESISN